MGIRSRHVECVFDRVCVRLVQGQLNAKLLSLISNELFKIKALFYRHRSHIRVEALLHSYGHSSFVATAFNRERFGASRSWYGDGQIHLL